jgi:hypothetical protein
MSSLNESMISGALQLHGSVELGTKSSVQSMMSTQSGGGGPQVNNQLTAEEEYQSRLFFGDLKSSSIESIIERMLYGEHLSVGSTQHDQTAEALPSNHRVEQLMHQLSLSEEDVIQEIKIFFKSLQQTPRPDFLTPRD